MILTLSTPTDRQRGQAVMAGTDHGDQAVDPGATPRVLLHLPRTPRGHRAPWTDQYGFSQIIFVDIYL